MSVATFDVWKVNRSPDQGVERVELLSALAYGRLTIISDEGSIVVLGPSFDVDSAGLVTTTAELDIVEERVLSDDTVYPRGPVQANFFQTDNVTVGEPFKIMAYDGRTQKGIAVLLHAVAKVNIDPYPLKD